MSKSDSGIQDHLQTLPKDFPVPSYADWKQVADKDLKGVPFEKKLLTPTPEGIVLQPLYTKENVPETEPGSDTPGSGSVKRASQASGYHGNPWDLAEEFSFGLAEHTAGYLKAELNRGLTAVTLILDEATQMGIDADYARPGQVGINGLSVSGMGSLQRAFSDIELDKVPVYVQTGFSNLPFLSLWLASAQSKGIDISQLKGSIEADPLRWLVTHGSLPVSIEAVWDEISESLRWSLKSNPSIKTLGISSLPYQEAGGTAVHELAFILSSITEVTSALTARGFSEEAIFSSIHISTGISPAFFMEIAKYRALRVLWSRLVTGYGLTSACPPVHARTSSYYMTTIDPHVNMLRATTEAFSAIAGGVQSIHTAPFDEVYSESGDMARRIARNTQIILKEESHLDHVIDPAGGSYYVESLTASLVDEAWKLFLDIESRGGMLAALKAGYPQELVNTAHESRRSDVAKRKSLIVGINQYANPTEQKPEGKKPDAEAIHRIRAEYLQKYRVAGAQEKHIRVLGKLEEIANHPEGSFVKLCSEAVADGATLGELTKALRHDQGEFDTVTNLPKRRLAEDFETLRFRSYDFQSATGTAPTIFLAIMGPLAQYKARADFSRGFFETGGFKIIYPPNGFNTPDEAVQAALESGAHAVVVCSTDETYPELVPLVTTGIKKGNAGLPVILAGYPKDQVDAHKASGVDDFIFMGANLIQVLGTLLNKIVKG